MLTARILTALVLGGAAIAAVFALPPLAAACAFAVLWVVGAWEWAALAGWRGTGRWMYAALVTLLLLMAPLWALAPVPGTFVMLVALLWWLVAFVGVATYPRPIPPRIVPLAGLLVLVPSWIALANLLAAPHGAALAMLGLVLVWAADVGAYVSGRIFGRVRLAPRVSPGKTWEGVLGGVLLAVVAAWVAAGLLQQAAAPLLAVALATALVSVVGDLTVSVFKREAGVKDTGRLLPGHGGVMDRIDGLTAALPVYALGLKLAGWLA